jgi:secreted Zn-dependent insulinase-like peptidase
MYKIAPIQDKKLLEISWMLKDKSKYYENPPATYLSYILGH